MSSRATQDIDKLQEVWEITKEWDAKWNEWKVVQLASLQTENMESAAQEMFKKLHILQRELKVRLIMGQVLFSKHGSGKCNLQSILWTCDV